MDGQDTFIKSAKIFLEACAICKAVLPKKKSVEANFRSCRRFMSTRLNSYPTQAKVTKKSKICTKMVTNPTHKKMCTIKAPEKRLAYLEKKL